ncbi:hypothetical protein Dvina_05550 [Dactylosporangium vinaceum]|uniref:Broad-specificity ulvan lyase N-terminal domain-containing protein n=1 Tax=Dactylosporangium vinaceum TaxID=53362 RepID=A0ABV5MIG3_9ACTN|nr:hypothetical protein [Dactylosporangium vinaceum]UAB97608.1 hypothetical protein Dvina_05550 [Dactylosporangium vinaceum]
MIAVLISATLSMSVSGQATAAPQSPARPGTAPDVRVPLPGPGTTIVTLVSDMVAAMQRTAPKDAAAGVWKLPVACWRCDAGPAWALASTAALTGNTAQRDQAVAIFDHSIATYQKPNGSFVGPNGSADVDTMFFAVELGSSAIALRPYLDPARYDSWTAAIRKAGEFLVANGNLKWYTNGNINIGNAYVMALAYRLTSDERFRGYYETALAFAVNPPQSRWAGYGLRYTKQPARADGSDGQAYFAEAGAGGLGFDPEYTVLQLDLLTKIYLANRDNRVLTYMNLLFNQLMTRVDRTTWMLNASKGTRHTEARRFVYFDTAALHTLALLGGRTDISPYLATQLAAIDREFRSDVPGLGDRAKYALGMITSSILASLPENARLR